MTPEGKAAKFRKQTFSEILTPIEMKEMSAQQLALTPWRYAVTTRGGKVGSGRGIPEPLIESKRGELKRAPTAGRECGGASPVTSRGFSVGVRFHPTLVQSWRCDGRAS